MPLPIGFCTYHEHEYEGSGCDWCDAEYLSETRAQARNEAALGGYEFSLVSQSPEPDFETLQEWMEDGGCESIDGCWVEVDGHCQHGKPSWMLQMGLI
jgi:hypothetical protein